MMAVVQKDRHCSPNDDAVRFFTRSRASSLFRISSASVEFFAALATVSRVLLLDAVSALLFPNTPLVNSPEIGAL